VPPQTELENRELKNSWTRWSMVETGYIGSVRDDLPHITGRAAKTLRQWADQNRESLLAAAAGW
jgi:hypothetical protein